MAKINITKRGEYYQYRFEVGKIDGKRKQVSKSGFKTKKEAQIAGAKALSQYTQGGQIFSPNNISVSDYLDLWFSQYVQMNLRYNSQLNYLNVIEKHLKPTFGIYKLQSLTATQVQEFVNELKLKGFNRKQVTNITHVLSGALNYAIEPLKYINQNPCNNIKYPKYENDSTSDKLRYLISNDDFNRIIQRFPVSSPFYLPMMIAYHTGLRIGEVFGLTWNDIDLEHNYINVNKNMLKRNFGNDVRTQLKRQGKKLEKSSWYFAPTKTTSSIRQVKFGNTLKQALITALNARRQALEEYGEYYTYNYKIKEQDEKGNVIYRIIDIPANVPTTLERVDLVCIRYGGEMVSPDSMRYPSRVINHEMNINFNMHSLRHTHATRLIENGASIKDVQIRLGHATIQTTLNTYVHDTEQMQNDTVNIFENSLK